MGNKLITLLRRLYRQTANPATGNLRVRAYDRSADLSVPNKESVA
ncbi:hypothetical protein [Dawidia cretensis]|nr:hypothetical protein [Dawidia cretensis]